MEKVLQSSFEVVFVTNKKEIFGIVSFIQKELSRVELSTEISHVKKLSRRVIQKLFYPNSTLIILPDFTTVIWPYLSNVTLLYFVKDY